MSVFEEFLSKIKDQENRIKLTNLLQWILDTFPNLEPTIKWNQPMFLDHGTYIIGFSVAAKHFAAAPERAVMIKFSDYIKEIGYDQSKMFIKILWSKEIDYDFFKKIIENNILEKANCTSFWR